MRILKPISTILMVLCLMLIFSMSTMALPPEPVHPWGGDEAPVALTGDTNSHPWSGDEVASTVAGDDDPFGVDQPDATSADPWDNNDSTDPWNDSTDPWDEFNFWFNFFQLLL